MMRNFFHNGHPELAKYALIALSRKQEQLLEKGIWTRMTGEPELSQTYSLLAEVMKSLSEYGNAYNYSKNAYILN